MTISSTTVKNSYSGDGSTAAFNYTFKIFADSDLQVIIRSSTGVETVKTITTHYTVSGAGDANGGSVTFTSGNIPASGETVVLRRAVPQTQAIDYIANDPFPAESHEEGLDRSMMTIQQIQEELDRTIKLSRTNTMTSTEFTNSATDRAGKVLGFDSAGELNVTSEIGSNKGNWSASRAYVVRDIVKDTSTNNIFMANTAHTSSGSQPLTTNTDSAKWDLLVDAGTATTSAAAAAASETAAAASATTASTQASNASTSASTASTQATNAASSATAAAASATAAAASADTFDDTYLGSKSSDPSTDNDGDALNAGDLYFNTTSNTLKVFNGSSFQDAALTSSDFVSVSEFKNQGTNFTGSLLVGHATTGTLSSAENNTAVGIGALDAITSGDSNVAIGKDAGTALTSGGFHVLVGVEAGEALTNTFTTTAIGYQSFKTANQNNNTGVGASAGLHTTGGSNTAVGRSAGQGSSGSSSYTNVALLGNDAGKALTTGSHNILLGSTCGDNLTTGSGNVLIGSGIDADAVSSARTLKIAGYDGSTTTTWISGGNDGVVTLNAGNITQQALTSSSNSVAWDASAKPNAVHVTTENTTFAAPTNNVEGAFIALEINYNGSHTIAFNTVFEFAGSTAPTFTSTDGKTDILVFRYNGAVWQEVGRTLNLSES